MVVDEGVASALRRPGDTNTRLFVAGCAERMAQLFTGLRGGDPERAADVDLFVLALDELWDSRSLDEVFATRLASLEAFPELQPDEVELASVADIYSFYAVVVARHACAYRASGAAEDALRCAHAALTAMGQLDQNIAGGAFMAQEYDCQAREINYGRRNGSADIESRQLRSTDQGVGVERLAAISNRLN